MPKYSKTGVLPPVLDQKREILTGNALCIDVFL